MFSRQIGFVIVTSNIVRNSAPQTYSVLNRGVEGSGRTLWISACAVMTESAKHILAEGSILVSGRESVISFVEISPREPIVEVVSEDLHTASLISNRREEYLDRTWRIVG